MVQWAQWLISAHLNKVFTSLRKNFVHVRKVLDSKSAPFCPIRIKTGQLFVDDPLG